MESTIYTTRNQLKGYGASYYQATIITKNIVPVDKHKNTNIYSLSEVIISLKKYLEKPKIKEKTRQTLKSILPILINQLNNIISVPFGKEANQKISKLTQKLFLKLHNSERKITESKALIATIKGKHKP